MFDKEFLVSLLLITGVISSNFGYHEDEKSWAYYIFLFVSGVCFVGFTQLVM